MVAVCLIALLIQVSSSCDISSKTNRLILYWCLFNMIFQIFNRMANISNDEKIMIGLPAEDDDEEDDDEGEKEDINKYWR